MEEKDLEITQNHETQNHDSDLSYIISHKHRWKKGDYVHAMYYPWGDTDTEYAFRCKTPLKVMMFRLDKEYYAGFIGKEKPEPREFLWIRCGTHIKVPYDEMKGSVEKNLFTGIIAEDNAGEALYHFGKFYRVGEYVTCPAKHTKGYDSSVAYIGPSARVFVESDALINELDGEFPHAEYIFCVEKNEYKERKHHIVLRYVPRPKGSNLVQV